MKAITLLSAVPVRTSAAESAEMCTQILFSETMELLEEHHGWGKVRLDADGYEGWVDRKMISTLQDEDWEALQKAPYAQVSLPVSLAVSKKSNTSILLSGGTHLPNYADGHFSLLGIDFNIEPATVSLSPTLTDDNLRKITQLYLNTPYLWGGRNAFGMDCSGFVQIIMGLFRHQLPRDASQQVELGTVVDFLTEAQAGDLAFFENKDGRIVHVGILLDAESVVHCSGRVKVSAIDTQGIVADSGSGYSHQLRVIKRLS